MAFLNRQLNYGSWVLFAFGLLGGFLGGIAFGCYLLGLGDTTLKAFDVAVKAAGVLATLMAVTVALFKDDLRKPRIQVRPEVADWLDEGPVQSALSTGVPGVASTSYVTEYFTCIRITNVSGILAKDCELHFVRFCKDRHDGTSLLPPLRILNSMPINPRGEHSLRLWELYLPMVSEPQTTRQAPALKIGDHVVDTPGPGTWFCTYRLTGANIEPAEIRIKITWDGQWRPRKAEMKLSVQEVKT